MWARIHGRAVSKRLIDSFIMLSTIVLVLSLGVYVASPARASMMTTVSVGGGTSTLFTPQGITIEVGDTVMWSCMSGTHTTTAFPGQAEYWDSGMMSGMMGGSFSWTFTHSGNFTYMSTAAGDAGQIGWVLVQQPAPEFPGYAVIVTVAAAVILALLIERRVRA